jgi:two-component system nitrogen regulation response regulator NtrX
MAQILVVDDEIGIRELLSEILADDGHTVELAENATAARRARARQRPDLVLLDIWMPDSDGITLLKEWAANGQLTMPVIMMSGHGTIETAVEATRIGAIDFLEKPIALQKLMATVKRALRSVEPQAARALTLGTVGRSPLLIELRKRLAQIAQLSTPVLMRGERGSMPELFARYLQQANTPWVDAEQAFTDAAPDLLQQASGGVLFVKELALLSKSQQKHLVYLVSRAEKSKVRLVSFTAEEPTRLLEQQGFDGVLLHALSGLVIALPPLRQYTEDVPDFAALMLAQLVESRFCRPRHFSTAALNLLRNFSWPGNLDDLARAVRTLAATALEEEIGALEVERVLPQFGMPKSMYGLPLDLPLREARDSFERAYFEYHLAQENGSIARVSEKSGVERTHLYRKLKALGIQPAKREDAGA